MSAQQQAIIIPPLFPSGTLPNPILPDAGMCQPGEVIDGFNVQTVFAPTNLAWKNFFGVSVCPKSKFSAIRSCCSRRFNTGGLQHTRDATHRRGRSPRRARYFTYNMYPLEILQSSVNPELLFVLPLLDRGLGR